MHTIPNIYIRSVHALLGNALNMLVEYEHDPSKDLADAYRALIDRAHYLLENIRDDDEVYETGTTVSDDLIPACLSAVHDLLCIAEGIDGYPLDHADWSASHARLCDTLNEIERWYKP